MFFNSSTGILADISNVCPKDIDVWCGLESYIGFWL